MYDESAETRGNVEIRICKDEFSKFAKLKPKGFWAEVVTVSHSKAFSRDGSWREPEVSWSSGGGDSTVTEAEKVDNFIEALTYAKEIRDGWAKSA